MVLSQAIPDVLVDATCITGPALARLVEVSRNMRLEHVPGRHVWVRDSAVPSLAPDHRVSVLGVVVRFVGLNLAVASFDRGIPSQLVNGSPQGSKAVVTCDRP